MNEIDIYMSAADRKEIYGFFSAHCLEPPSDSLTMMIQDQSILEALKPEGDNSTGYAELVKFVKEDSGMADLQNELIAEHSKLFLLPADIFPQESFYLDKRKFIGGKMTTAVSSFYEMAGAKILKDCTEMPDHIGIELQFMQFLCNLETNLNQNEKEEELAQCIDLQKRFLEDHLLKWAFLCCEKIIAVSKIRFYTALANLLMEFLKAEQENIVED
ncbi:MAG: molecular chaperone TorD family protein [Desulfobacula sp.]|nr:molecular chaperone TorD family protein [Desulfobacula sp.]